MNHGRQPFGPSPLNLSNSIGSFVSRYPHLLAFDLGKPLEATFKQVQESIRVVPHDGRTFEALKFLSSDANSRAVLHAVPEPQVRFNFQQRLHGGTRERGTFALLGSGLPVNPYQAGQVINNRMYCSAYLMGRELRWVVGIRSISEAYNQNDVDSFVDRMGKYLWQLCR